MKKNIAILIPSLKGGGAERVASLLSCNLPSNINQYIILYDDSRLDYPYKGKLISLDSKHANTVIEKMRVLYKRIKRVKEIKRKYHIDATISFLESANVVNLFARVDDKVILSIRNYKSKEINNLVGQVYKLLIKFFYNKADGIASVSELIKKDLVNNFNVSEEKISVIYNPYDIKKIQNLAREEIPGHEREIFDSPVIINMGRLTEQKGQINLIRSFLKVKKTVQNAHLVILGEGKLLKDLKRLAKRYKIESDIHFLGFKANPFCYIKRAKVFVLSSLYEGFPNALVEAMSCNTPVISTDCKSGPREIIAPCTSLNKYITDSEYAQYGILVPPLKGNRVDMTADLTEEEEIMADAITSLLTNRDMHIRYTEMAGKRASQLTIDNFVSKFITLIE